MPVPSTLPTMLCKQGSLSRLLHAVRDLAPPGDLTSMQTYSFEFNEVEMLYDSYRGLQVRLR